MLLRRISLTILLALAILVSGCTTDGSTPAPTFTRAALPPAALTAPAPVAGASPQPQVIAPADATVLPDAPTEEPLPAGSYTTATLQALPKTCLRQYDYQPFVDRYMSARGWTDLKEMWDQFDKDTPVYGLMSSLTDRTDNYALATTYSKMLLVGEYKIAVNRPGAVGYAHCAVLIYMGGDEPEVGVGVLDATLNGTWSGYAYGEVRSEAELRAFIHQRIGKPVIVRYHVSQDPGDSGFVRNGFFSPTMKLLWQNSYYTRFAQNPDLLKNSVQSPRGPSMQQLMGVLANFQDTDIGVFIDYLIDPIL